MGSKISHNLVNEIHWISMKSVDSRSSDLMWIQWIQSTKSADFKIWICGFLSLNLQISLESLDFIRLEQGNIATKDHFPRKVIPYVLYPKNIQPGTKRKRNLKPRNLILCEYVLRSHKITSYLNYFSCKTNVSSGLKSVCYDMSKLSLEFSNRQHGG